MSLKTSLSSASMRAFSTPPMKAKTMFDVYFKKTLWAALAAAVLGCGDGGSKTTPSPIRRR
jgi:hypothetical protein